MTFPAQLPPPSPALRLHQAAARLRRTAQAAQHDLDTDSFWKCYDPATAWRDGFENGMGGICSQLAGLLTPQLALQLAEWLDATGAHAARHGPASVPAPAAAIAHALETEAT
ncbi:hypothetical protein ACFYOF_16735 [Streptomyces sp. NPDC007148]|uniref:hypothetical protein n=1 Tax=Streptomyces sp. NPDC007148 TaxID=3364775 RepID=UPI0036845E71